MQSKLGPEEPKTDNLHPVVARLQREIERDGLRTPRLDSEGRVVSEAKIEVARSMAYVKFSK